VLSPDPRSGKPGWIDNMFDMADSYIKRRARLRCSSFYRQGINIGLTRRIKLPSTGTPPAPGARPNTACPANGLGYKHGRRNQGVQA
jgi:hypothetical protein